MTTTTAELVTRIGQLKSKLEEATAKGFSGNVPAMKLLTEMKEAMDQLETLATTEFWE